MLVAGLASLVVAAAPGSPVAQAVASYERGDYLAAATLLERVLGSGLEATERRDARLYLAATYFAMGDTASTERVLTVLLHEVPALTVDSALFPPPFVARLEAVRATVRQTPPPEPPRAPAPEVVPQAHVANSARGLRSWWWAPTAVAVVGAGLGTGLLVKADGDHRRLVTPPTSPMDVLSAMQASELAQAGALAQSTGWAALAIGAAGLVTLVLFLVLGSS